MHVALKHAIAGTVPSSSSGDPKGTTRKDEEPEVPAGVVANASWVGSWQLAANSVKQADNMAFDEDSSKANTNIGVPPGILLESAHYRIATAPDSFDVEPSRGGSDIAPLGSTSRRVQSICHALTQVVAGRTLRMVLPKHRDGIRLALLVAVLLEARRISAATAAFLLGDESAALAGVSKARSGLRGGSAEAQGGEAAPGPWLPSSVWQSVLTLSRFHAGLAGLRQSLHKQQADWHDWMQDSAPEARPLPDFDLERTLRQSGPEESVLRMVVVRALRPDRLEATVLQCSAQLAWIRPLQRVALQPEAPVLTILGSCRGRAGPLQSVAPGDMPRKPGTDLFAILETDERAGAGGSMSVAAKMTP